MPFDEVAPKSWCVEYDAVTGKVLSVSDSAYSVPDPGRCQVTLVLPPGEEFDGTLNSIPWQEAMVVEGAFLRADDAQVLSKSKGAAFAAIDARTDEIISRGFEFQGKRFSTSLQAQARFLAMDQLRSDPLMQFPITWNTNDDLDAINIPDADTLHALVLAGVGYYRAVVDSGSVLKALIRTATSLEEVAAVQDLREFS